MVLSDLVRGHVERAIDISLQSIPQTLKNIRTMKEALHLKEEEGLRLWVGYGLCNWNI
jgi:hypothetical protein